jgi:transcriptional repressor of cell division inhibition gene dicB
MRMKKSDVIDHFGGSQIKVAKALGITKSAVSQWKEVIPEGAAYKLQVMTAGVLRVDPALYPESDKSPAAA